MSRRASLLDQIQTALALCGQSFNFQPESLGHSPAFGISEEAKQRLGGLPRCVLGRPPLPLPVVAAVNELRGCPHHVPGQDRRSGLGLRKVQFQLTGQEFGGLLVGAVEHGKSPSDVQAQGAVDAPGDVSWSGNGLGGPLGILSPFGLDDDGLPLGHRHALAASEAADAAIAIRTGGFVSAGVVLGHGQGSQVKDSESAVRFLSKDSPKGDAACWGEFSVKGDRGINGGAQRLYRWGQTFMPRKPPLQRSPVGDPRTNATRPVEPARTGFVLAGDLLGPGSRFLTSRIRPVAHSRGLPRACVATVDNRKGAPRPAQSYQSGRGAALHPGSA